MACGVPVVTGHVPALMEVAGGAVELVERLDAESLGDVMVALARNGDRRHELSGLGLERAQAFSWQRAARETLDVYREAARHTARSPVLDPAFTP
jgi:glycosyltransferase involved in cell wall biosynthesis